ncbi:hypothetical protein V6N11_062778 [Hibiscus sabdariffa]|uniref:RNase H type-1 domain-containing protein n=1 Tax=Hibiscus sabdariffa TaxID=183260 RepID=A0ABR2PU67_9ROSI
MLPNSLRGGPSKILMKKLVGNPSAKKVGSKQNKRDGQNSSPPTLEAGLSTLMKDLHNAVNLEESNLRTSPSVGAGEIGRLATLCVSNECDPAVMVADMVTDFGTWDWPRISPLLPPDIRDQIAAVQPPPRNWIGPDTPGWRWTGNRQFTTSSAYSYLSDLEMSTKDPIWKKVWALYQYLNDSTGCDIYEASTEDMDHVLRHCDVARSLWCRVLLPDLLEEFMITPFDVWLRQNVSLANVGLLYGDWWSARFVIYCWLLWKDRCSVVLASDRTSREDILPRGNRLLDECVQVSNSRPCHYVSTVILDQLWSHPAPGWVKGNVDATVHTGNGQAAIGDCLEVIRILQWISHSLSGNGLHASIRKWTEQDWKLVIRHIPRTCNTLADKLSTWGRLNSQEIETFMNPHSPLISGLIMDQNSSMFDPIVPHDWFDITNNVSFNLQADPGG